MTFGCRHENHRLCVIRSALVRRLYVSAKDAELDLSSTRGILCVHCQRRPWTRRSVPSPTMGITAWGWLNELYPPSEIVRQRNEEDPRQIQLVLAVDLEVDQVWEWRIHLRWNGQKRPWFTQESGVISYRDVRKKRYGWRMSSWSCYKIRIKNCYKP